MSDLDKLWEDRAKAAKFASVGDTYDGIVVHVSYDQLNDFNGDPETWPDGEPKKSWVVELQTDQHDDADDDGRRTVYCRTGMHRAWVDACKRLGKENRDRIVGGRAVFKYTGNGKPAKRGWNPPKLYEVELWPADRKAEQATDGGGVGDMGDDIPFAP